jgi:hypothetical protein
MRGIKSDSPKIGLKNALDFSKLPINCHECAIKAKFCAGWVYYLVNS